MSQKEHGTKNELLLIALFTITAISIKSWFFFQFNFITKDDFYFYIPIADNLLRLQLISVDGVNAHTIFPPGFPSVLAILKLIGGNYEFAFFVNYVIFTTATSLIAFLIFRNYFDKSVSLVSIPLFLFYPLFITSNKILGTSSEHVFTLFIWAGFYFLVRFFKNKNFFLLAICNSLFGISYLIRPEGLLFMSSSFVTVAYLHFNLFKNYKTWLSFIIPVLIFVFPYLLFLHNHLNVWTLSGKVAFNQQLSSKQFGSQYELWYSNAVAVLKFLIAPLFFNPLITAGLFLFCFFSFTKQVGNRWIINIIIMLVPALLILIPLILYFPWSRGLYPFMPVFIFCTAAGFYRLFELLNFKPSVLNVLFTLIMCLSLLITIMSKSFKEDVFIFKAAAQYLNKHFSKDSIIISSRQPLLKYYLNETMIHENIESVQQPPDVFVLSNFEHYTIHQSTGFEKSRIDSNQFYFNRALFKLQHQINSGSFAIKIYSK